MKCSSLQNQDLNQLRKQQSQSYSLQWPGTWLQELTCTVFRSKGATTRKLDPTFGFIVDICPVCCFFPVHPIASNCTAPLSAETLAFVRKNDLEGKGRLKERACWRSSGYMQVSHLKGTSAKEDIGMGRYRTSWPTWWQKTGEEEQHMGQEHCCAGALKWAVRCWALTSAKCNRYDGHGHTRE